MNTGIRFLISAVLFFCAADSFSQNIPPAYTAGIALAEKHSQAGKFLEAARSYERAFSGNDDLGLVIHRYDAAKCWASAGVPDSAFYQLQKISAKGYYDNLVEIANEPAFNVLHHDNRWNPLLLRVKANLEKTEGSLDKKLVALLDSVRYDDQRYRKQLNETEDKYGRSSKEYEQLWSDMERTDSVNLDKVRRILDKYGWPGKDITGERGSTTLFLVIQHADIRTQEQYLPQLRDAVKRGDASASRLALMEDRVAIRHGRQQIYGSQIGRNLRDGSYYVLPLEDPENVDKRRAAVGLPSMKEYVIRWGILWSVDRYRRDLEKNAVN